MSKTLITGGHGFIGQHLCRRLPDGQVVRHESLPTASVNFAEQIFFLSAYGNMAYHRDVAMMLQANVVDPIATLLRAEQVKWFLYLSSSSVNLPIQTPYSRSKASAEQALLLDPNVCVVRPYSVTGVGEQREHLIPKLIESCISGATIPFCSTPTHDFIDVSDLVDGLMALARNVSKGLFEIGNGKAVSNLEVMETVERVTGRKANIQIAPSMRAYDHEFWRCPSKDGPPRKSLEQSIREMVEVYEPTAT